MVENDTQILATVTIDVELVEELKSDKFRLASAQLLAGKFQLFAKNGDAL
jgi:hypothetical protein